MTTTNLLKPTPVSSRQFDWDPTTRQYVGEISDTNGLGRVWNDACDEGLTIVSASTGREVVFVVTETLRSHEEGNIASWLLVPADLKVRAALRCSVLLFND